jgi:hypothetical protein
MTKKAEKRKTKQKKQQQKNDRKFAAWSRVNNLTKQLQERLEPTFDRGAFQASSPSDNTQHGSVRSAVLGKKKPKAEFDKNAWKPPCEDIEKQPQTVESANFDKAAWGPSDGNTE